MEHPEYIAAIVALVVGALLGLHRQRVKRLRKAHLAKPDNPFAYWLDDIPGSDEAGGDPPEYRTEIYRRRDLRRKIPAIHERCRHTEISF